MMRDGQEETIDLTENDLVFVTNGSCTESSALGDNEHAPVLEVTSGEGASWTLWKNIALQHPQFGRPEKFCSDINATKWESATVTLLDEKIVPYVREICQRDPYSGKVVTGGIVTVRDSAWLMSWTFNRQPHFKAQPANPAGGLDLRPLSRPSGRLCGQAHERVHRRRDLHGMALSPGASRKTGSKPWPARAPAPCPA